MRARSKLQLTVGKCEHRADAHVFRLPCPHLHVRKDNFQLMQEVFKTELALAPLGIGLNWREDLKKYRVHDIRPSTATGPDESVDRPNMQGRSRGDGSTHVLTMMQYRVEDMIGLRCNTAH